MTDAAETEQTPGRPERSAGWSLAAEVAQLLAREVDGVAATLRGEVDRMQTDAIERARDAAGGAAYLGAAAARICVAVGAVATLPLLLLRKFLPAWLIAILVAAGAGAGATALGRRGLDRVVEAAPGRRCVSRRRRRGSSRSCGRASTSCCGADTSVCTAATVAA